MLPKLKECLERRLQEIHENIIQTLKERLGGSLKLETCLYRRGGMRRGYDDPWGGHPPGWGWPPDPWGHPPPWGPPPGWGPPPPM